MFPFACDCRLDAGRTIGHAPSQTKRDCSIPYRDPAKPRRNDKHDPSIVKIPFVGGAPSGRVEREKFKMTRRVCLVTRLSPLSDKNAPGIILDRAWSLGVDRTPGTKLNPSSLKNPAYGI